MATTGSRGDGRPAPGSIEAQLLRGYRLVADARGTRGTVFTSRPDLSGGRIKGTVFTIYNDGAKVSEIWVGKESARANFIERPRLPVSAPRLGKSRLDWPGGGVPIRDRYGATWIEKNNLADVRTALSGVSGSRRGSRRRRDLSGAGVALEAGQRERGRRRATTDGSLYWALNANPAVFNVEAALQNHDELAWMTSGSQIAKGDRVLFWKSFGNEPARLRRRGIVGLGEVITDVTVGTPRSEYWVKRPERVSPQVLIRTAKSRQLPIWMDEAPPDLFEGLTVVGGQGPIFRITPEQWERILAYLGGWPETNEETDQAREVVAGLAGKARGRRGQAFLQDAELRVAIEEHAMTLAVAHFAQRGYEVLDVHAVESYDLRCIREGVELHVEVKGTTSKGDEVLLTPNEVAHARLYADSALFVVSEIEIRDPIARQLAGGRETVFNPWQIDNGVLEPVGFRYLVPQH